MHTKRITQSQYEALASFRYALRKFLRFSEAAAQSAGLTAQQHQALLAIKGFPGRERITVGELAERLQLAHHSVVGLVDRLGGQKYVKRMRGTHDRRQVRLALTARGERILDRLSKQHREELRNLGPEIRTVLERLTHTHT